MFSRLNGLKFASLALAFCGILVIQPALSGPGKGKGHGNIWREGPNVTIINGTDDWTLDMIPGPMTCSEGVLEIIDGTPVCPPGSVLQIRDFTAFSDAFGDDPRFAGYLTYTYSGDFDALMYTGPAWGTWRLDVIDCDGGYWEGGFSGERGFVLGQPNPVPGIPGVWISSFELQGIGVGGCVDGAMMKGTEIITTLTPSPMPYELLEMDPPFGPGLDVCGPVCLPEGVLTGKILTP